MIKHIIQKICILSNISGHVLGMKKNVPNNIKNNKKLIEFFKNDPRNINNKFFCEICDEIFLHYRAGGNWRREGLGLHKKLISSMKNIVLE